MVTISREIRRSFLGASGLFARSKPLKFSNVKQLKLREPITPTHKNFDVSPDHPLWQFFAEVDGAPATFREINDLPQESRPWTMSELRRKSFDDLHIIWYKTLKERNILAREARLGERLGMETSLGHDSIDAKLVLTQKRLKQTLLERQVAYERAQLLVDEQQQYLESFKQKYLDCDESQMGEYGDKLVRLQYALFGLEPNLLDHDVDEDISVKFVQGVSYVANLKLARYLKTHPDALDLPLVGVMEELPFMIRDVEEAVAEVKDLRASGSSRKLDKIDVFPFLRNAIESLRAAAREEAEVAAARDLEAGAENK